MDEQTISKWEQLLNEQIILLQNCQTSLNKTSCLNCDKLLDCELRKDYINAVYSSMSKGSTGGFEF